MKKKRDSMSDPQRTAIQRRSDRETRDRDDDAWFVPKRHGFGVNPAGWQGWALLAAYAVAVVAVALIDLPIVAFISLVVALTSAFIVIAIQKTRGEWRWRWGGRK